MPRNNINGKRSNPRVYRKIYKQYYGPIPKDENGNSYHIHHIDGNCHNNDPVNLIALSAKEHYDIHYSQCDWGACARLASREILTAEEISAAIRRANMARLADGTHPFLHQYGENHPSHKRVNEGSHNFLHQKGANHPVHKKIYDRTHHWFNQSGELHPRYDKRIHKFEHADGTVFIGTQLEFKKQNPKIASGALSKMISGEPRKNGKFIRSLFGWKYNGIICQIKE